MKVSVPANDETLIVTPRDTQTNTNRTVVDNIAEQTVQSNRLGDKSQLGQYLNPPELISLMKKVRETKKSRPRREEPEERSRKRNDEEDIFHEKGHFSRK